MAMRLFENLDYQRVTIANISAQQEIKMARKLQKAVHKGSKDIALSPEDVQKPHLEVYAKEIAKIKDQFGLDNFMKGWYTEPGTNQGDLAVGYKIEKTLFHEKSKYQDILIFENTFFGRVLVLDDMIQLSEKDAFVYQEMAAFLPLNCHPNPKKVLIIGCGDGGLVLEITKHPLVESITLCEIDQLVIDASKKYLPFTAKGFESPKLKLYVGDGAEYLKKHKGEFDVIINDAPEPTGPALSLYEKSYFESIRQALKPGGILMSQVHLQSPQKNSITLLSINPGAAVEKTANREKNIPIGYIFWYDLPVVKEVMGLVRPLFPVVNYAISYTGSYPGGTIGYILSSTSPDTDFRNPVHKFSPKVLKEMGLKYYTPGVHRASMGLPLFIAEELGLKWEP